MPDASVTVNPQAFEGQRHTIVGYVWARCAPGFLFSSLTINITQGQSVGTETGGSVDCDGLWHKQQFTTSEENWVPGPATYRDAQSERHRDGGLPRQTGHADQARSTCAPARRFELPATAVLRPNHVVKLVLKARCDKPWVLGGFGVGAQQGTFPKHAGASIDTNTFPTCDGALHSLTVYLKSTSSTPFKRGWVSVDSYLHTLDPQEFDPAPSATAMRAVKVT